MEGRVLAVDPGSVNIGIAVSDPMRLIAKPLTVIKHTAMVTDCLEINQLCQKYQITLVLIGQALGAEGEMNAPSRHAQRMAEMLGKMLPVPVVLWDESGSTQQAKMTKVKMGVKRKKRSGHLDAHAAAVILQSYLDSHSGGCTDET